MGQLQRSSELNLIAQAEQALIQPESVDDILAARASAELARDLVRRARLGQEQLLRAASARLRAERALGRFLQSVQLVHATPGNQYTGKLDRLPRETSPIRLDELGITKKASHQAQRIACIPEEEFERYLVVCRQVGKEPTIRKALEIAKTHAHNAANDHEHASTASFLPCLAPLVAAGKRFTTIYVAPTWPPGEVKCPVGLRLVAQLLQEPVSEVSEDNAHLHVWTPNAYLQEALGLIRSWRFEHASTLVAHSQLLSRPRYWNGTHMFLLLGVRGDLPFADRDQPAWIEKEGAHSLSPTEIVARIERVSPGPYLQLFGCISADSPDWTSCGTTTDAC